MKLSRLKVGALFMDMGTGKTRTAIELIWLRRHLISRCVWCCPVSLMETTRREILFHTSCLNGDIHVFDSRTKETNIPPAGWHIVGWKASADRSGFTLRSESLLTRARFWWWTNPHISRDIRSNGPDDCSARDTGSLSTDPHRDADHAGH